MSDIDSAVWEDGAGTLSLAARDVTAVYRHLIASGVSQRRIADATGQSQSEVSEIVAGRQVQSYDVLVRIAKGFGVPCGWTGLAYDAGGIAARETLAAVAHGGEQLLAAQAAEPVRQRLRGAVSEAHRLVGWASGDVGMMDHCRWHMQRAMQYADGDPVRLAGVMASAGEMEKHYAAPDDALKFFQLATVACRTAQTHKQVLWCTVCRRRRISPSGMWTRHGQRCGELGPCSVTLRTRRRCCRSLRSRSTSRGAFGLSASPGNRIPLSDLPVPSPVRSSAAVRLRSRARSGSCRRSPRRRHPAAARCRYRSPCD